MHGNATIIDSAIHGGIFNTPAMREVWSDKSRIQRHLDVEKALSLTQGRLGVTPMDAADEITAHCQVAEMDFDAPRRATEHVGYPV